MTYKYEPLTRVKWLMEEHDLTLEEAEKRATLPVCITEIAEVYWKIEGATVPETEYCFRTKEDIFIDDAEWSTDEFKLDFYDGEYHVLALSDEDFYVSDDVTDQFDVGKILEACQAEDRLREETDNPIENRYDEYMQFLDDQDDDIDEESEEDEEEEGPMYINLDL